MSIEMLKADRCEHDCPLDVIKTLMSWRALVGDVHTEKMYYRSRYYQVFVEHVRCQNCKQYFEILYITRWHRDGYYPIKCFGDENERKELMQLLKAKVKEKYHKRLSCFDIKN